MDSNWGEKNSCNLFFQKSKVLLAKGDFLKGLFQTSGRSDTAVLQILVMELQFIFFLLSAVVES